MTKICFGDKLKQMDFKHDICVLVAVITLFLLGVCDQSFAKACTGSVYELPDVGRRGPSYTVTSSEPTISDSTLPSGWYVAKDNARYYTMVNGTAPRFAYCGTDYPIYIKDNIAKVDEDKEYDYEACLVDYDNNCKQQYDVKIRRCGREIQYFLHPTDGMSAYCFEPSSLTVVEPAPNYRIPYSITVSVALMYIETSQIYKPELDFKCNFGSASNLYYYEVNWVINGRIEKTFTRVKVQDVDSTNLNETTLRMKGFSLGISIQCGVRISSSVTGNQTSPQMSDTFYAGVKIQTPRIQLASGESADIILQPTVPLGCGLIPKINRELNCSVDFEMFDPNSRYTCGETTVTTVNIRDQKLCGSRMFGWQKNNAYFCINQHNVDMCSYSKMKHYLGQHIIRVTVANDDLQYPEDKTFTLQLKTVAIGLHSFWKNSRLDDVQIIYKGGSQNLEWRGKGCSVINDPTLNTFDENYSITYMKQLGTFLMYNNTHYGTEVQIKTQRCTDDGTNSACTCAAAIKAGGDVLLVDICNKVKRASFTHCRTNVLNVREIGSNDYEIYFPTGTKVHVEMRTYHSDFLRVHVFPSPVDVGNTEGLCGNLNGRTDEQLTDSYFTNWRLQRSLFDSFIDLPSSWTYEHNVCICPRVRQNLFSTTISPDGKDSRAMCFSQQYAICTDNNILQGEKKSCTIRNKRSVERHRRNIHRLFSISQLEEKSTDRKRKSIANAQLSETEAYKECISLFQSKPVYNMRNDLPNISMNESLSACVNDMMIDGHDYWKDESYNNWVTIISQEIGRNHTFRKENENVVRNFKDVSCPAQCNGNGDCVNGTCVCKNDFVGDSCFIKKSTPLELTDIEGGGECDLAHGEDCHECLQFHTVNLLKGFKCNIKSNDLDENGTVILSDEHKRIGEYENIFEGYCCPSAVETRRRRSVTTSAFTVKYTISVSNDGVNFGPGRDVYVYDSTCQSFVMMKNGDWKFSLKDDTCFINGGCYRHGEGSMMNPNLICCPFKAKYTWSTSKGCGGSDIVEESNKTALVAVAVSVSGVLIVALVVVFAIWTYKSKKRYISSKEPEPEPDYTKLYFQGQPFNTKFDVNGKAQFHQPDLNVFVTDYEQLKK